MNNETYINNIYNISKDDNIKQKIIAIEEMSELIKEIVKDLRSKGNIDNIIEEISDVKICIDVLQKIYDIPDRKIDDTIEYKINRYNSIIQK